MTINEELNQKTINLIISHYGFDPRIAQNIEITMLEEYPGEWSLLKFQKLITQALEDIPTEYKKFAKIELSEYGKLKIYYYRLQNPEEVATNVAYGLEYAKKQQVYEWETYERLKKKFEGKSTN